MSQLGRQVSYGLGKETVAGTEAAVTNWINQLSFGLADRSEYANNESAYGVLEKTNSSTITRTSAEGSLEAKLTDRTGGYFLLGAFGSVSTAANPDVSGNVKDHTFTINQSVNGQTFTLVRKDELTTKAYTLSRFDNWQMTMALDDYIKFSADIKAKKGNTTTATVAYTTENEFVAKHFSIKSASSVAGLAGATDVSSVTDLTLTMNANLDYDWSAGSGDPESITSRGYELNFEMTTRYNNTTFEDAYRNGTELAFQISLANTDVTIGTAENPSLVFTAPKVNITDWTRDEGLDDPISQTFTGTIHYSAADAYSLRAVLTSLQASY